VATTILAAYVISILFSLYISTAYFWKYISTAYFWEVFDSKGKNKYLSDRTV
jgi:hypothetical protein